ncbi:hypothetical protein DITRI_Ditri04bG0006700 [Diplodiscus trichospermus]
MEAITWVETLGLRNIIFESEARIVVDVVHSTKQDSTEFGSLDEHYRSLLYKAIDLVFILQRDKRIKLLIF